MIKNEDKLKELNENLSAVKEEYKTLIKIKKSRNRIK